MREYWSYCGEIESLDLMRFPDTGRFKGIAFITFADVSPQGSLECSHKQALDVQSLPIIHTFKKSFQ